MESKFQKQLSDEQRAMAEAIAQNILISQKLVLSAPEAARYMGVSLSYLYKLTMQGKVPFSKPLGKMCFFDRLELEKFLMSNRQSTAAELQDMARSFCDKKGKGGRP